MNPLVEEAMRLAVRAVAVDATENLAKLRAFLEQHLVLREPLSPQQIDQIAMDCVNEMKSRHAFVRAIEFAHGITKKGTP